MPRRTALTPKAPFATRLDTNALALIRKWAAEERRSLSEQLAILIEQEHERRNQKPKPEV
jgi:hypothetical protein